MTVPSEKNSNDLKSGAVFKWQHTSGTVEARDEGTPFVTGSDVLARIYVFTIRLSALALYDQGMDDVR